MNLERKYTVMQLKFLIELPCSWISTCVSFVALNFVCSTPFSRWILSGGCTEYRIPQGVNSISAVLDNDANRRRSSQRNLSSGHAIIVHTSTHVVERVQCQTSAICFHDAWNDMVAQRRFIADECYWWLVISMKAISSRTSRRDVERADFKNQFISTRLRITQLMSSF